MFKYSSGMRFSGFCIGCFFGWAAWLIYGGGNPDQVHLAVSAAAFSLVGFLSCFATE